MSISKEYFVLLFESLEYITILLYTSDIFNG